MIYLFSSLETKDDYFYNPEIHTVYILGDYISVQFRIDDINSQVERCGIIPTTPLIIQKRYKMLENKTDEEMHYIINNVILEKIFDKL